MSLKAQLLRHLQKLDQLTEQIRQQHLSAAQLPADYRLKRILSEMIREQFQNEHSSTTARQAR
jgi:hypothetical protein